MTKSFSTILYKNYIQNKHDIIPITILNKIVNTEDELINLKKYNIVFKHAGYTPGDVVNEYKQMHHLNTDFKVSFLGKLDPMASGFMCLLQGDQCKNMHVNLMTKHSKIYIFDLVFGFSTDTNDFLGMITNKLDNNDINTVVFNNTIIDHLEQKYTNYTFEQPFPIYSSRKYKNKPLWTYTKSNTLDSLGTDYPTHTRTIDFLKVLDYNNVSLRSIITTQLGFLSKIDNKHNFRQDIIKQQWLNVDNSYNVNVSVISMIIGVSNGTYIRQLCDEFKKEIFKDSNLMITNLTRLAYY